MSDAEAAATPPATAARPHTQRFRRAESRLTPDQRRRQAEVTRLTLDRWSSPDQVKAFLNDHHEALGGRPLDLAVDSEQGFAAVARHIGQADPA